MRHLAALFVAFALTACSIQGMVEKAVPENVRADHMAHVDSLLAKDTSGIEAAFGSYATHPDGQKTLIEILENVPDGKEIRRDYVGMNSAFHESRGGRTHNIDLVTEVQTEGGFMTVTGQYKLMAGNQYFVLRDLNAVKTDSSPVRAGLEALQKAAKIAGIIILLIILAGIVFFLVRRKRKKEAV